MMSSFGILVGRMRTCSPKGGRGDGGAMGGDEGDGVRGGGGGAIKPVTEKATKSSPKRSEQCRAHVDAPLSAPTQL